jgi:hypothetical protein
MLTKKRVDVDVVETPFDNNVFVRSFVGGVCSSFVREHTVEKSSDHQVIDRPETMKGKMQGMHNQLSDQHEIIRQSCMNINNSKNPRQSSSFLYLKRSRAVAFILCLFLKIFNSQLF